jgi:hypothetical protein
MNIAKRVVKESMGKARRFNSSSNYNATVNDILLNIDQNCHSRQQFTTACDHFPARLQSVHCCFHVMADPQQFTKEKKPAYHQ